MTDGRRVSIIIPAYNESSCLSKLHEELTAACQPLPYQFDFLIVNDGSTDDTEQVLADLNRRDERVDHLLLPRNLGHQGALSAGLAVAKGDAVIMMDADLQHPPSVIPRLLDRWEAGYEIVNTVRLDTADSSLSKKLFSRGYYGLFTILTGVRLAPGSADFRLLSRQAVEALNRLPECHRFIRGLIPSLAFRQTSVTFHAPARWAGRPKYTMLRSIRLALEGLTAFSAFPVRFVATLGLIAMGGQWNSPISPRIRRGGYFG